MHGSLPFSLWVWCYNEKGVCLSAPLFHLDCGHWSELQVYVLQRKLFTYFSEDLVSVLVSAKNIKIEEAENLAFSISEHSKAVLLLN